MGRLSNDHLLTTLVIDLCDALDAPTLWTVIDEGRPRSLFRSDHRLEACPEVYDAKRVQHEIVDELGRSKPIRLNYHTEHLVSSTGTMTLAEGHRKGYIQSVIARMYDREDCFEVEPLIIGNPWLDHPRNNDPSGLLMWIGRNHGEVVPEDIDQFSRIASEEVPKPGEWETTMRALSEAEVKVKIASLLRDSTKSDWGGEQNDHFSANVSLGGKRKTAAFLLKGPAKFREMTPAMCGKNGDQIFRLTNSGADISIVQHCHAIGEAVRHTLKALTVYPGDARKFCVIDGPTTFRLFRAYGLLDS